MSAEDERALRAAERRQVIAADAYDRGSFAEAAAAYAGALAGVEAGARDDRHNRAALHANVAACLRRDKRPLDAVAACDAALALLPRYGRALFRRAVCLLEAGRPGDAVEAFEALYRVDRAWPRLSEWLLRAIAAQRRVKGRTTDAPQRSKRARDYFGSGAGSSPTPPASPGAPADDEIAKFAAEKDHYVVLGLTCDATEKQIKAAYRMRSLKYHPDRAGASHTAAFQRVAAAFAVLSDADKRAAYDQGVDVKAARKDGRDEDDSEDEAEEHKQSLREEIERKYYPERYDFWPFGDPFIHKRKLDAQKAKREGRKAWEDED
jgi:tetratricopeptide (TPR) repeat protein